MNHQLWNIWLTTSNKGQPNRGCVNAQTWMKLIRLSLWCRQTASRSYWGRRLVEILNTIIKDALENLEISRLEGCIASHHLQEKQTRLQQLLWDLAFLHTRQSVCLHTVQLLTLVGDFQQEALCGFHANWGTTDMILWQIQEKSLEHNMHLYIIFVNFTKQGSAIEHLTETKVPWPLYQACICISDSATGHASANLIRQFTVLVKCVLFDQGCLAWVLGKPRIHAMWLRPTFS